MCAQPLRTSCQESSRSWWFVASTCWLFLCFLKEMAGNGWDSVFKTQCGGETGERSGVFSDGLVFLPSGGDHPPVFQAGGCFGSTSGEPTEPKNQPTKVG